MHRSPRAAVLLVALSTLVGCGGSGDASDNNNGTDNNGDNNGNNGTNNPNSLSQPVCVWNQAYQENYAADDVATMVDQARGCYVLVDPFESTPAREAIPSLSASGNIVGCYISTGTCEDWREDYDAIAPYCISTQWEQWEGEYFVDRPEQALVDAMKLRVDKMAAWGCNMVEFDNMDWAFDDDSRAMYGFRTTAEMAVTYNAAICAHVRASGMECMAKNTREGAQAFGGGTFESYSDEKDWWDHEHLQSFLDEGRPGIVVHYDETDCDGVYNEYKAAYGPRVSFICEDRGARAYRHFGP